MTKTNCTRYAFTLIEAMVVIAILCLVLFVFIRLPEARHRAQRIRCVSYQKQITLGFKQWALDHSDRFPMQESVTNGGTMELISAGYVWPHFQVTSNEMNTPYPFACPADRDRAPAASFTSGFNDSAVSYFLGVDARDTLPQALLTGDSNLLLDGTNLPSGPVTLSTNSQLS